MSEMKTYYKEKVAPALMKKFSYKSVMQVPKLDKIVINVGCGEVKDDQKKIDAIMGDIAQITGQKPIVCRAKKAIANFKLREGNIIGVKVTLRGETTRLQRHKPELVRRQRKLQRRNQGTA